MPRSAECLENKYSYQKQIEWHLLLIYSCNGYPKFVEWKIQTFRTRPIMNSEHLAQQGAYKTWKYYEFQIVLKTWKSCLQYLRPSNSKKTPFSNGRKHWAQTKHLAWKRSPFELIVFPFSSRASLQWLQLRGGFRGGFAGALIVGVGELDRDVPSTWKTTSNTQSVRLDKILPPYSLEKLVETKATPMN